MEPIWALGLMSGTSMDGIDAAMVLTDGVEIFDFGASAFRPYTTQEAALIESGMGLWPQESSEVLTKIEHTIRQAHADVIGEFEDVALVGFHGQTLSHDPANKRTFQIGDGARLAKQTGLPVVWDFRTNDVQSGGQGAPLAPFFHFACAKYIKAGKPTAFLNLGGVANVTLVHPNTQTPEDPNALLAFDTGPANAPLNDLMMQRLGLPYDEDGQLSAQGQVDETIIRRVFQREFFTRPAPKSLDRNDFADALDLVAHLNDADAAATLCALSAACVAEAQSHMPPPKTWYVTGGGRLNPVIMRELRSSLNGDVKDIDETALDGDMLEAQAFAYLAVRSQRGLPLSSPTTTGCPTPQRGGQLSKPL